LAHVGGIAFAATGAADPEPVVGTGVGELAGAGLLSFPLHAASTTTPRRAVRSIGAEHTPIDTTTFFRTPLEPFYFFGSLAARAWRAS
jgi:hypothetical protein